MRTFHDNRLGLATLTRLDRLADEQVAEGTHQAARLIAQDFDSYLKLIESGEATSARAGLFLARRTVLEVPEEHAGNSAAAAAIWASPALGPIATLARADLFARTGAALPAEIDTRDLDYAARADWTAEQWQRAHESGLLARAQRPGEDAPAGDDEPDADGNLQSPKPRPPHSHGTGLTDRVWFDPSEGEFLTNFPPPEDFEGYQNGRWGCADYERALTVEEEMLLQEARDTQMGEISADDAALRQRWFDDRTDGKADVLGLYDIAEGIDSGGDQAAESCGYAQAEPFESSTAASPGLDQDDEDAAFLNEMAEHDPLVRAAGSLEAGYAAAERGDVAGAMAALEQARLEMGKAGRPRPSRLPRPNRKARRAAAARKPGRSTPKRSGATRAKGRNAANAPVVEQP